MNHESTNTSENSMSLKDAIRLKHEINQQIQYGGMNALEFKNFKTITAEDWQKVKQDYQLWMKHMTIIPFWVYEFGIILLGILYFIYQKNFILIFFILSIVSVSKRLGHQEGYLDGFESGRESGIQKAFDISDDALLDISERAIEMQIDDRIISKTDNK